MYVRSMYRYGLPRLLGSGTGQLGAAQPVGSVTIVGMLRIGNTSLHIHIHLLYRLFCSAVVLICLVARPLHTILNSTN